MNFDWDNDGKDDWHDDAIFHTILNPENREENENSNDEPSHTEKSGCSGSLLLALVVGYLILKWIVSF